MPSYGRSVSAIKASLTALLLGCIYPLAFAPYNFWGLGIFSVSGLFLLLNQRSVASCFLQSFCYGLGVFSTGVWWLFISINDFSHTSFPIAIALTSLFVIALALTLALPMALFGMFNSSSTKALLAFPSLMIFAECCREWLISGWLDMGYGYINTPLAGWAPIGGVLSISWIAAFSAATLALTFQWKKHNITAVKGMILATIFWAAGWFLTGIEWTSPHASSISVGTIQPSLTPFEKWNPANYNNMLDLYREQTSQLTDKDIIVWPEAAIPRFAHEVKDFLDEMDKTARQNNTALIIGIPTQGEGIRGYFNSVISLGNAKGQYHKQHLLPFGEYMPLEEFLRGTIGFFDLPMSKFTSGNSNRPLQTGDLNIGTAVCFEITFPALVSDLANQANLLLTVSNDSWFGDSIGPKQHFQMAQMRALENSKPLIRATNNGISAIIDHKGRITATIPAFERAVLTGTIKPREGATPYNRWSSSVLWLSILILLLSLPGIHASSSTSAK